MKKLLLILLLAILPIQSAWSMAAVYCGHEQSSEPRASHFGHHGHQHQALAGDDDGGKDHQPGKTKAHSDCEVCHHAVQASVLDQHGLAVPPITVAYARPPSRLYLSPVAEGPPRPNWLRVA
ncbi:hypothetical protein ASF61_17800 [Duganella sp. Leaf126]|uniref:DUF2946 family protein n=1 Tax=Duganella sp. Leaf126 TaxID=1736266 RepID=UPI0006F92FBE|nr:DUF2946 family protein [Duganella sp. Leaf126]KQQ31076.1 hypothetical protein ASF61_17800 [Duganella sp. Leaf126]